MVEHFHFHVSRKDEPATPSGFSDDTKPVQITKPLGETIRELPKILWPALVLLVLGIIFLIVLVQMAHAGGPKYVAGASYFDPAVKGAPLTWAQGSVQYYTDQGDLSPILLGPDADAFVADAFSRWTSVSTAAISATRAGQLSENVSGANVMANSDHTITLPIDIQSSAVDKPVALVYDFDGQVSDAFLGAGASDPLYCFTNAVFGGLDNFSTDGHLAHALVIINGKCTQTSDQLPDVKYRLVRVLGNVLGLDWSQLNLNVITRTPVPAPDDFNGFPLMHFADLISCVPVSLCYPNPDQPKMDDRAAISRLYPVTAQNQASFPGKQLLLENTVRIHGSVRFVDSLGQPAQPMQGVNVVARWVDPATGIPSRRHAASSASGFLFRGNAGNPVNGYTNLLGQRFDRFGSDDGTVEGFFDFAGLEIPDGSSGAQYQLSVEAIDWNWSQGVGPYAPLQITPSGTAQPITVTASKGDDVQQDLLMQGSATAPQDWGEPASFSAPAALPLSGDWVGSLSGYGNVDYFQLAGQAFRTISVEVTALDESGAPSQSKAQPIVGMWALTDPVGTLAPASTPSAFNTSGFGLTRLKANLLVATSFRIGITDDRGDGRPDFHYHARVLYGDTVSPAQISAGKSTPIVIYGLGFRPGLSVNVGGVNAPLLAVSANQIIMSTPAFRDGNQTVTLTDPSTGASSAMRDVLTFGAGPTDTIRLIQSSNPATPVGGETPNPIRVGVTSADGVTPVSGATVVWSVASGATLAACGGGTTCPAFTDATGEVSTRAILTGVGVSTITATLAPASYKSPKAVQTTVLGTSSSLDIALTSPFLWIAQGATLGVPLKARVLSSGASKSDTIVNYQILRGSGSLSAGRAVSDSNGYATVTLTVTNLTGDVQVSACVAPANNPCQTFSMFAVALSALQLKILRGTGQMVTVGQVFEPVVLRVTDSSPTPNPVQGAGVTFQSFVLRPLADPPIDSGGESNNGQHAIIILSSSQLVVTSDSSGLASLVPSPGSSSGAVQIEMVASAGTAAAQQFTALSLWPVPAATVGGAAPVPSAAGVPSFQTRRQNSGDPNFPERSEPQKNLR